MKKCLGILAVLLLVSGAVQAATTLTNTVNSGPYFGTMQYSDLLPAHTITYSHTGILPLDGVWNTEVISSSTLAIRAYSVNTWDTFTVKADGVTLGNLTQYVGGDNWTISTFSVSPTLFTSDGTLSMQIVMNAGTNVQLDYSTLTVVYDQPPPPPPPPPPDQTIPAPGAVVLGALGLGLVSWLRSRNTL